MKARAVGSRDKKTPEPNPMKTAQSSKALVQQMLWKSSDLWIWFAILNR